MINIRYQAFIGGILLFFALLPCLIAPRPSQAAAVRANTLTESVITVGCELDYPPYEVVDSNGNADGFSIDLIKAIAAEMNLTLRFLVAPWNELRTKLERGAIDALPAVAYSVERDRFLDFGTPYIISHAVIFTRNDASDLNSHDDLRGKEVMVMRGDSTHEYAVSSQLTEKLILTNSFEEAFTLLADGHHDAVIAPELVGLLLQDKLHITNLKHIPGSLDAYGKGYAFAVHQGNEKLLAQLNRGLDLVKASGEYTRIYDKWFSHIMPRENKIGHLIRKTLIGLALLALLLLFNAIWNALLRRKVRQRTNELISSERRFSSIFSQAAIGLTLVDLDGKWLRVNPMLCSIVGYSSDELLQMSFHDITHPDDLGLSSRLYEQMLDGTRNTYSIEKRYFHKDGHPIWVNLTVSLVRDGNDKPEYFVAAIEDINERVKARKKLAEDEKLFRALFQSASDYALVLEVHDDSPPQIIDANDAAFLRHGYSREEMIGQPITLIDRSASSEAFPRRVDMLKKGKVMHFDVEHICKNGTVFSAEAAVQMIQLDGRNICFSIERDITERKMAQARIEMLSQAITQSGEAVIITDAEGYIGFVNPSFTRISGYTENEAMGKTPNILKSGNQKPAFYKDMWAHLIRGEVWQGKVVNRKKSGEFYPAMLTISPVKNSRGEITNFIGLQQDLQSYEELEAQFHQAQKMEAIGTLVGGIAHNFNNDLAGITGNIYLAKRRIAADPAVVDKLEHAEKIAFSAAATIQQLLTFPRKGNVQMHPLSIAPFLKEAFKMHRATLPENIGLQLEMDDADMRIEGDINQLQQMLMNLITNAYDAVEHRDKPEITIRLDRYSADQGFIKQHEHAEAVEYARITISDNGCGISEEHIKHIFEPFYTTKEIGKGTGLGLAMVYGSVSMHGGAVEIASSPDGTTVQVYLPQLLSERPSETPGTEGSIIHGHGETILLVDDNEMVLATGSELLKELGFRVLTAKNGFEAVETYHKHRHSVDMLILDVVMPGMGGIDALEKIREINPDVRVMFATGYDKLRTNAEDISELVISKPFSIKDLTRAIRQTLTG